jgi:hypothetical protein
MTIGAASLISQFFPDYDRYLPLGIGLVLVLVFAFTRNYLALVGAGVLTGLGTGLVVAQWFPGNQADGAGAVLGLGLGFISIWVVSRLMSLPSHHLWPLIPGTILTVIGAGLAADAFSTAFGELLVPAVVLVLGIAFLIGGLLTSRRAQRKSSAQPS